MAEEHDIQDSAASVAAKPVDGGRSDRGRRTQILVLGLNAWVVASLWPTFVVGAHALVWLPPCVLLAGLALLARPAWGSSLPDWSAQATLLGAFPTAIALSIALRPAADGAKAFGPLALCVLVASLIAFAAAVALGAARHGPALAADHSPLPDAPTPSARDLRRALRHAFHACVVAGAFAIGVVAPTRGGLEGLQRAWGNAALEGGLLTAVVGTALAVAIVGFFLGDGVRSARAPEATESERNLRVATLVFLTLLGAVTYFVVIWRG